MGNGSKPSNNGQTDSDRRAKQSHFWTDRETNNPVRKSPYATHSPPVTVPPLSLSIVASFPALTNDYEDEQSG